MSCSEAGCGICMCHCATGKMTEMVWLDEKTKAGEQARLAERGNGE